MTGHYPRLEVDYPHPILLVLGLLIVFVQKRPNKIQCGGFSATPFAMHAYDVSVGHVELQDDLEQPLRKRFEAEAVISPRIRFRYVIIWRQPIDMCHRKTLLIIPKMGIIIPNMGTIMTKELGLAGALFSDVQQRVLALIFGHPERSFYT